MFWNKKEDDKRLPDLPPYRPLPNTKPEILDHADEESHQDFDEDTMPEKHFLPSFPDNPVKKGFSQSAIKDAVSTEDVHDTYEDHENDVPVNKNFKTVEISDFSDNEAPMQRSLSVDPYPIEKKVVPAPKIPSFIKESPEMFTPPKNSEAKNYRSQMDKTPAAKSREIFVKIDKFHTARKSLEIIKEKVGEIDDLLKRIRETKLREEQELSSWEKEIGSVKSRIQDVNDNIFEKLE